LGKIMGGRSGGRPKGAKNTSTVWREAQELIGDGGLVVDVADPLEVIEQVMRYFYGLGVHGAKSKAPLDQVQKCFQKARSNTIRPIDAVRTLSPTWMA
jgi:hypothetical protein